jgi:hypothetical protein
MATVLSPSPRPNKRLRGRAPGGSDNRKNKALSTGQSPLADGHVRRKGNVRPHCCCPQLTITQQLFLLCGPLRHCAMRRPFLRPPRALPIGRGRGWSRQQRADRFHSLYSSDVGRCRTRYRATTRRLLLRPPRALPIGREQPIDSSEHLTDTQPALSKSSTAMHLRWLAWLYVVYWIREDIHGGRSFLRRSIAFASVPGLY